MKRADLALTVIVAALALFVGVMVARRPVVHPAAPSAEGATAARAGDGPPRAAAQASRPLGSRTVSETADRRVTSRNAAPRRDVADIRARIADATDTYMTQMLPTMDWLVTRWPDRREQGLRVFVQSAPPNVTDWDGRYAQMARDAFDDWRDGLPARLDFVFDSASADITVGWSQQFAASDGQRVGVATRAVDQFGWLVAAQITIAIHDSTGAPIPPDGLAGIMRHEAGHALGLGHSADPRTKMFPVEMVAQVQPADRATLRLLYSIPPGPLSPP